MTTEGTKALTVDNGPPDIDGLAKDPRMIAFLERIYVHKLPWPSQQAKELGETQIINYTRVVGDFLHPPDNAEYRILGARMKRTLGECVEYDIARLPKKMAQLRGPVPEVLTRDSRDFVLRLCTSDDVVEQKIFSNGFVGLKKAMKTIPAAPVRAHFATTLGAGAFTKIFAKESDEYDSKIFCFHFLQRPRPYYIIERVGPTFEELLRNTPYGFIDLGSARHLAIGAILALEALHSLEMVHRCVASYTFAVRTVSGGFLGDGELSKYVVIRDLTFSCIYRNDQPPKRVTSFVGTLKYSSPSAMKYYCQTPTDDVVSVLYLFVELLHGRLPWRGLTDREKICKMKEEFPDKLPILVDDRNPDYRIPIDLRDLSLIFNSLDTSGPYTGRIRYQYAYEVLHRIVYTNGMQFAPEFVFLTKLSDITKQMSNMYRENAPGTPKKKKDNKRTKTRVTTENENEDENEDKDDDKDDDKDSTKTDQTQHEASKKRAMLEKEQPVPSTSKMQSSVTSSKKIRNSKKAKKKTTEKTKEKTKGSDDDFTQIDSPVAKTLEEENQTQARTPKAGMPSPVTAGVTEVHDRKEQTTKPKTDSHEES